MQSVVLSIAGLHAGSGDVAVVKQLLSLGCDATAADRIGWSPLLWATAGGHAGVMRELDAAGADILVRDTRGRVALHWAAEKGHVDAVDLLVDRLSELQLDLHTPVPASLSFPLEHQRLIKTYSSSPCPKPVTDRVRCGRTCCPSNLLAVAVSMDRQHAVRLLSLQECCSCVNMHGELGLPAGMLC